jgi:predicted nucleic acid-binding protein
VVIAYLDSSVVMRVTLGQPSPLAEWGSILTGITSVLTEVECARTLDRLRVLHKITAEEAVIASEAVARILAGVELIDLDSRVLRGAGRPRQVGLGTLDALHLATAEIWRDEQVREPLFATHDRELALAARASGFKAIGI